MTDRLELEQYWRQRWTIAKRNFEEAQARFKLIQLDDALGCDRGSAYCHALAQETAALIEYSRALRLYTDLMLRGKLPDEDS